MFQPVLPLTKEQFRVATHGIGHAKVSAVAGSGKTATLIERIAYLVEEKNVDPRRIMVLMFNKDAAVEFESRLEDRICHPLPTIKTFHSLGVSMLKRLMNDGSVPYMDMGSPLDAIKITKECLASVKQDTQWGLDKSDVEVATSFLDLTKATLSPASDVYAQLNSTKKSSHLLEFVKVYENVRRQRGLYFYSDMIKTPVEAIKARPQLGEAFNNKLDYLIVDEYQDINAVQQELTRIVAGDSAQVLVVGDCDQCIYRWRGAEPEFLLNRFELDFPGATSYTLSMTFRYGSALALAANNVISRNQTRDPNMVIARPDAAPTALVNKTYTGYTDTKNHVTASILEHQKAGGRLSEVAILGRLYSSLAQPELALLEAGIPYNLNGGTSALKSPIAKFAYACLSLATGECFKASQEERYEVISNFLSYPRTGMTNAQVHGVSMHLSAAVTDYKAILYRVMQRMGYYQQRSLKERILLIQGLVSLSETSSARHCLDIIQKTLNLKRLIDRTAPNRLQADELTGIWNALTNIADAENFTIREFFDYLDEKNAEHQINTENVTSATDAVNVLSVHRSKGLEWDLVIMPGLESDKFPYQHHDAIADNTEDERRLFYVAMTRAKKRLVTLTPPDDSLAQSSGGVLPPVMGDASQFVHEAHLGRATVLSEEIKKGKAFIPNKALYADWVATTYIDRTAQLK